MQNIVPKEIIESPEFKPFFDAVTIILAEMKKQNSRTTLKVKLPKNLNWEAESNYGITVRYWFEHNFGSEYRIVAEPR